MIIHECVFEIAKTLNRSSTCALSDHLYNVISIVLSPMITYAQKIKKLKGDLIRIIECRGC